MEPQALTVKEKRSGVEYFFAANKVAKISAPKMVTK
jgi:hypothetical protein